MTPKVVALVLGAVLLCLASVITPFLLFSNSTESIVDKISVSGTPKSSASVPPQPLSSKTAVPNHSHRSIDNPVKMRGFLSHYKVPVAIALGALVLAIVASIIVSVVVLSTNQAEATSVIEDVPTEIKPEDNPDPESMEELVDSSLLPLLGIVAGVVLVVVGCAIAAYFKHRHGGIGGCMLLAKSNELWEKLGKIPKGDYQSHFVIDWLDFNYEIHLKSGVECPKLTYGEVALILFHNLDPSDQNGRFALNRDSSFELSTPFVRNSSITFSFAPTSYSAEEDRDYEYLLGHVDDLSNIYSRLNVKDEGMK